VTWNGHRYLAMPNSVRIGPVKVNLIGYQSVRRDRPVKIHGRPEGMGRQAQRKRDKWRSNSNYAAAYFPH